MKCCICGKEFDGYGNNPYPVGKYFDYLDEEERCCDECNDSIVIPVRISEMGFRQSVVEFVKRGLEAG